MRDCLGFEGTVHGSQPLWRAVRGLHGGEGPFRAVLNFTGFLGTVQGYESLCMAVGDCAGLWEAVHGSQALFRDVRDCAGQ